MLLSIIKITLEYSICRKNNTFIIKYMFIWMILVHINHHLLPHQNRQMLVKPLASVPYSGQVFLYKQTDP